MKGGIAAPCNLGADFARHGQQMRGDPLHRRFPDGIGQPIHVPFIGVHIGRERKHIEQEKNSEKPKCESLGEAPLDKVFHSLKE